MAKAHKEVDSFDWENEVLNYDTIQKLMYIKAILWETLRMFSLETRLEMQSCAEYKLGDTGIVLLAITVAAIPSYVILRDPKNFPNPDAFEPERFFKKDGSYEAGFGTMAYSAMASRSNFFPFGNGPRMCVGMRLGIFDVLMALTYVLKD